MFSLWQCFKTIENELLLTTDQKHDETGEDIVTMQKMYFYFSSKLLKLLNEKFDIFFRINIFVYLVCVTICKSH